MQLTREFVTALDGQRYRLDFEARSDVPRDICAAVGMARAPWTSLGLYNEVHLGPEWQPLSLDFIATADEGHARVVFDFGGDSATIELRSVVLQEIPDREAPLPFTRPGRMQMDIGVRPVSDVWGTNRGTTVHEHYLEGFLSEFKSDERGQVLRLDGSVPRAALADELSRLADMPNDHFDCIVCTHALDRIPDARRAVRDLHRVLRPGGVLLVAVPQVSICGSEGGELWRFTPEGLLTVLSEHFDRSAITIRAYGNALTAAGELRGVVAREFTRAELSTHDSRFPVEVCGRAVKAG